MSRDELRVEWLTESERSLLVALHGDADEDLEGIGNFK